SRHLGHLDPTQTSGVTEPLKWRAPERAFQPRYSTPPVAPDRSSAAAPPAAPVSPSAGRTANATRPGSSTGLPKVTSQVNASVPGAPCSTPEAASARAAVYIPWAIARLNPNSFAGTEPMWIGFRSPETSA